MEFLGERLGALHQRVGIVDLLGGIRRVLACAADRVPEHALHQDELPAHIVEVRQVVRVDEPRGVVVGRGQDGVEQTVVL